MSDNVLEQNLCVNVNEQEIEKNDISFQSLIEWTVELYIYIYIYISKGQGRIGSVGHAPPDRSFGKRYDDRQRTQPFGENISFRGNLTNPLVNHVVN